MRKRLLYTIVAVLMIMVFVGGPLLWTITMPTATPTVGLTEVQNMSPGLTPQVPYKVNNCGINNPVVKFVRQEGPIELYSQLNTNRALPVNSVRSVITVDNGFLAGLAGQDTLKSVVFLDGESWEPCGVDMKYPIGHVNDLYVDWRGYIWVGTDGNGVFMWDGRDWTWYNSDNSHLIDDRVYDITRGPEFCVLVATWSGISSFCRDGIFDRPDLVDPAYPNQIHRMLFIKDEVCIGYIHQGVSCNLGGDWEHFSATEYLGSNEVRDLELDPNRNIVIGVDTEGSDSPQPSVSRYNPDTDTWFQYPLLPVNRVNDIAFDPHGRLWVAGWGGLHYYQDNTWVEYSNLPAFAVAFGCTDCTFDETTVVAGLISNGLLIGELPLLP